MTLIPEQSGLLDAFEADLYASNEVMNLTNVPREAFRTRHFEDSILFHDLIPAGSKVLDIGCGPGFPCWPIALVRPDLDVTGMDSSGKMLALLRRHPLPNLEIIEGRAETCGIRQKFDWVTGRAVAPLAIQLELSATPLRIGGTFAPMRTPNDETEIHRLANAIGMKLERIESRTIESTDIVRLMPLFKKIESTAKLYPRGWAAIRKSPL